MSTSPLETKSGRRTAALAMTAALLGGCFTFKPLTTTPAPGTQIRVQYTEPRPDLSVVTAKQATVAVPHVRTVTGQVLDVRSDSIRIRVLALDPQVDKAYRGTTTLLRTTDRANGQQWSRLQYSPRRTLLILSLPPLLLLFIAACLDCGGSGY